MSEIEFDNMMSSCGASEPFALRVIGDEMLPEFKDGHIIVIDPGGHIRDGCFIVANTNDEYIFRQLFIEKDQYVLRALQSGVEEIALANGVENIVGVVSQRSGRRRSEHKRYDV